MLYAVCRQLHQVSRKCLHENERLEIQSQGHKSEQVEKKKLFSLVSETKYISTGNSWRRYRIAKFWYDARIGTKGNEIIKEREKFAIMMESHSFHKLKDAQFQKNSFASWLP